MDLYIFFESNFIELILNNLVQPFSRSVGFRIPHLIPGQMQKK